MSRKKANAPYVHGSAAYQIEHENLLNSGEQEAVNEKPVRYEVRKNADLAKINKLCTMMLVFSILATLGLSVLFLNAKIAVHQTNMQIQTKKQELALLVKENAELEDEINSEVNLEEIRERAFELGMQLPSEENIHYIAAEPITYTSKLKTIEVKEEDVTVRNLLAFISKGW